MRVDAPALLHDKRHWNSRNKIPRSENPKCPADPQFPDQCVHDGGEDETAYTCAGENETQREPAMLIEIGWGKGENGEVV